VFEGNIPDYQNSIPKTSENFGNCLLNYSYSAAKKKLILDLDEKNLDNTLTKKMDYLVNKHWNLLKEVDRLFSPILKDLHSRGLTHRLKPHHLSEQFLNEKSNEEQDSLESSIHLNVSVYFS